MSNILDGRKICIVPSGIVPGRLKILRNQIDKHGGTSVIPPLQDNIHIVLLEEKINFEDALRVLKIETLSENTEVLRLQWLIQSIKEERVCDTEEYRVERKRTDKRKLENDDEGTSTKHFKQDEQSSNSIRSENKLKYPFYTSEKFKTKFACARPSGSVQQNLHSDVTEKLEQLANAFKTTKDQWRAFSYQKAINILAKHPTRITTREEARCLPGIGERLADKIWEILSSGNLRKVDEVCGDERTKTLQMFTNVWGAGPTTAVLWYQQGLRTLEDVKDKANLTRQQQIGLRHYDDLLDRMSREEAARIESAVKEAALRLVPGLEIKACGSYRREKVNCGDVDVLISHPDNESHQGLFTKLLDALHHSGFLTDDLVKNEKNGEQHKYLGVCKLPGENNKHRRLDIIVVPWREWAPALLYFTGSAHFNRSMRLLASKMGMSLNEHGLKKGVVRKGREKITDGYYIHTPTEQSIFEELGIPYQEPKERNH